MEATRSQKSVFIYQSTWRYFPGLLKVIPLRSSVFFIDLLRNVYETRDTRRPCTFPDHIHTNEVKG